MRPDLAPRRLSAARRDPPLSSVPASASGRCTPMSRAGVGSPCARDARRAMQPAGASRERENRVPRLAPGWERCGLTLSPAEGFLLSRIDGSTPWALLREIGGLAPARSRPLPRTLAGRRARDRGLGRPASGSDPPGAACFRQPRPRGDQPRIPARPGPPDLDRSAAARPGVRGRSRSALSRAARRGPWASTRRPSSAPTSSSRRNTTPTATTAGRSAPTPRSSIGSSRRSSRPTSC